MISIKEVDSKSDLIKFIKFPFKLYKNSKFWVPPIIDQEIENFDKVKNPNIKQSKTNLFLAYMGSNVVGRIVAIINNYEVEVTKIKKIRFGWFDFIDDFEVSKKLLDKIDEIGRQNKLEFMEGPMGFTNLDKVGVLTSGFDKIGTMITTYNHEYYKEHFIKHKFVEEKKYHEKIFEFKNIDGKYYKQISDVVKQRNNLQEVTFTKTSEVLKRSNEMFDLFNDSYAKLSSFVKINEEQKQYMKKKYIKFINPEYIKFVENENKKLVAFAIVMPSFAWALQKTRGYLFPFGIFYVLFSKFFSKKITLYLIGIHPDYQKKGVTAIIFNSFIQTLKNKGIKICRRTPELTENISIDKIWENFSPELIKTRSTFKKKLSKS